MNDDSQGTPSSLEAAVLNGLRDSYTRTSQEAKVDIIKRHVKDYMVQKFTPDILRAGREKNWQEEARLNDLCKRCTE